MNRLAKYTFGIDLEYLYNLLAVLLACWALLLFGCAPTRIGCTPRQERKAQKHLQKAHDLCERQVLATMLQWYPMQESDSTRVVYKEGETIQVPYAVYVNCDSIAKAAKNDTKINTSKVPVQGTQTKRVDTVDILRQILKEDGRKIALYELDKDITKAKYDSLVKDYTKYKLSAVKKEAKQSQTIKIMAWALGIFSGITILWFAVKNFKPKIPFVG